MSTKQVGRNIIYKRLFINMAAPQINTITGKSKFLGARYANICILTTTPIFNNSI